MSPVAPGVYTTITAASASPNGNAPTGTWFVTGITQQGPTGVAIPITSMNDYANYLGPRVTYGALYDSLDEFFHDGGVLAYVSRITGPASAPATITLNDRAMSPLPTLVVTAAGNGTWGNTVEAIVANGSVSNSYTIQIVNNGVSVVTSPNLFSPQDAVTWSASLPLWSVEVVITNSGSVTASPNNNPATGTFTLTGGLDDDANVTEAEWTAALVSFDQSYGPGQVSAPGHTTTNGYNALITHAVAFNRVALLDVADNATASALVTQAQAVQALAPLDTSYCAMFAPWVIIPGITSTNPGSSSPVPTRTIPPSAVAAALMALNDQTAANTANTPAAGANGQSKFAIGVTHAYTESDRGVLNAAGVDLFKVVTSTNAVTLYGYRSLAVDPNWTYFNNVRFRMQMINDFDAIGEFFIFDQIDGRGQLFARFNGALAGKLLTYYTDNALFGATSTDAFVVNTGPQVNTTATIAAGELNAEIGVVMSPFSEFVYIQVSKFLVSQGLPAV